MDQEKDYKAKIAAVRAILAELLGGHDDNGERFGQGEFYCAMQYGDRGQLGDMVWYVRRYDDVLRRRIPVGNEWRAFTPEKVAEALLKAYASLAPPSAA
jgi:hypothetical protein